MCECPDLVEKKGKRWRSGKYSQPFQTVESIWWLWISRVLTGTGQVMPLPLPLIALEVLNDVMLSLAEVCRMRVGYL